MDDVAGSKDRPGLAEVVGARIRALRAERGLSLSELARRAGLGKGTLSELESGRRNPTLETLYSLTVPLQVGLADLLEPARSAGPVPVPPEPGDPVEAVLLDVVDVDLPAEGGRPGVPTAGFSGAGRVEVFRLRVLPGGIRRSPSHGPGVREQLTVLSGTVRVGPRGRERLVGPGRTWSWISDTEHVFEAVDGPAVGILLITGSPLLAWGDGETDSSG